MKKEVVRHGFDGYNSELKTRSRELRRDMTRSEKRLWYDFLCNYETKFYRQRPIFHYIADFYAPRAKLVIEIGGPSHFAGDGMSYDEARTEMMNRFGIRVIRFTNADVAKNFDGVCLAIARAVAEQTEPGEDIE